MARWFPVVGAAWATCLLVTAVATPAFGGTPSARSSSGAFAWLTPSPAPARWARSVIPAASGQASVAYPPGFAPIGGDAGAVSFAVRADTGAIRAYLNVTPRQGPERLRGFAGFRVRLLREDDATTVHREAAAEGLHFQGGRGSCVLDTYVTKVGRHRYREIACFVAGQRGAAVVVATATTTDWTHFEPWLRRSVASFALS